MTSLSMLVPWSVSLFVNLVVFGSALAVAIVVAFRVLPATLTKARHLIALSAFCAASLVPILAATGVNTHPGFWVLSRVGPPSVVTALVGDTSSAECGACRRDDLRRAAEWTFDSTRVAESAMARRFCGLWVLGLLLLMGRDLVGHIGLARARRTWQPAPASLREELKIPRNISLYLHHDAGPSAIGWLRPAIVLPYRLIDELPLGAVAQVARHELHHIRQRDPLINACVRVVRAILWPSWPLWFLERAVNVEREAAADRAALRTSPPSEPSEEKKAEYAAVLFSVARWARTNARRGVLDVIGTHARGKADLEKRVSRLLTRSQRYGPRRLACGFLVLLCGAMGLTLVPVVQADVPLPAARVMFGTDGHATLIRRTDDGESREAVLQRSEDDLRASSIVQVLPLLPSAAAEAPSGAVFVLVLVDERGQVVSARAVAGHGGPLATQRALEAARQWKFTPAALGGQLAKVVGELTFFGALEPPNPKGWRALR